MVTPDLKQMAAFALDARRVPHRCQLSRSTVALAAVCAAALVAATGVAAVAGAVDPALAASTPPHPTLHPTLAAAASILVNNARVLALPYGLLILRLDEVGWGRTLGSALLVGVLGANAVTVGLALGRWQARLIPYLPHLPLEWAAAGLAASVWTHALTRRRRQPGDPVAATSRYAPAVAGAITLLLLGAAAAVEVLLTPHAA